MYTNINTNVPAVFEFKYAYMLAYVHTQILINCIIIDFLVSMLTNT